VWVVAQNVLGKSWGVKERGGREKRGVRSKTVQKILGGGDKT
jgi:hypothetical protein